METTEENPDILLAGILDYLDNDTLREIMINIDGQDLLSWCQVNKKLSKLCEDQLFWRDKYSRDFPLETFYITTNYRDLYRNRLNNPPGDVWNLAKAKYADENAYAINVPTGKRSHIKNVRWHWPRNPNVIYHTGYRIAGTAADITNALKSARINNNTINEILNSAISYQNYTQEPFKSLYDAEILKSETYDKKEKELNKLLTSQAEIYVKSLPQYSSWTPNQARWVINEYKVALKHGKPFSLEAALEGWNSFNSPEHQSDQSAGGLASRYGWNQQQRDLWANVLYNTMIKGGYTGETYQSAFNDAAAEMKRLGHTYPPFNQ